MDDGMVHHQGHMNPHHLSGQVHTHAQGLVPTGSMNGHGHGHGHPHTGLGHSEHDFSRKYGLSAKLMDDTQANMTLNLVKSEAIPSHYLCGSMDHQVGAV